MNIFEFLFVTISVVGKVRKVVMKKFLVIFSLITLISSMTPALARGNCYYQTVGYNQPVIVKEYYNTPNYRPPVKRIHKYRKTYHNNNVIGGIIAGAAIGGIIAAIAN